MIAASGTETAPVAEPLTKPQSRKSCHSSVIPTVSSAETAIVASAIPTTRLTPKRSISAAANGAPRPKQSRFSETASPIVSWLQPNSSCSGISSTPVVERNPDASTSARNPTPATTQA
jgi:hypothetical protein